MWLYVGHLPRIEPLITIIKNLYMNHTTSRPLSSAASCSSHRIPNIIPIIPITPTVISPPMLLWVASPVKAVTFEGVAGIVTFPVPFEALEPSPTSPRPTAAQAVPERARIPSSSRSAPKIADLPVVRYQSDPFSRRSPSRNLIALGRDL